MTDEELSKLIGEFLPYPSKDQHYALRSFAKLVAAAENEACAKVCDEQEQRSQESSEKSKRERDKFMYHHCAVTAKWNAAAIRARREQ